MKRYIFSIGGIVYMKWIKKAFNKLAEVYREFLGEDQQEDQERQTGGNRLIYRYASGIAPAAPAPVPFRIATTSAEKSTLAAKLETVRATDSIKETYRAWKENMEQYDNLKRSYSL
jgi:hypothetical protein